MDDDLNTNNHQEPSAPFVGMYQFCRARALGFSDDFAECLVAEHGPCPFRLPFGWHYYCYHPDRREIVGQTLREEQQQQQQ